MARRTHRWTEEDEKEREKEENPPNKLARTPLPTAVAVVILAGTFAGGREHEENEGGEESRRFGRGGRLGFEYEREEEEGGIYIYILGKITTSYPIIYS